MPRITKMAAEPSAIYALILGKASKRIYVMMKRQIAIIFGDIINSPLLLLYQYKV